MGIIKEFRNIDKMGNKIEKAIKNLSNSLVIMVDDEKRPFIFLLLCIGFSFIDELNKLFNAETKAFIVPKTSVVRINPTIKSLKKIL
ncbi:MAG: hypothetical protein ACTSRP_25895 [Candidatus Helarchaeota archaeon]